MCTEIVSPSIPTILAEHIVHLPADKLVPYAKNARRHSAAQINKIKESIKAFGFTNPVLISAKNEVIAGTGGLRGATDIFMKDVYVDLDILERYVEHNCADEGIALVMTDMERLIDPKSKTAKHWVYDISQGAKAGPIIIDTPIAMKPVMVDLKQRYDFQWTNHGDFWFLELQGQKGIAA